MYLPAFIMSLKQVQKKITQKTIKPPRVVISSDEEGNSFGDIDEKYSFSYDEATNTLILYPINSECDL